jgi:hypothetical protein
MKQKDIALIIIVIFFSALISFFVSNALFGSAKSNQVEVEVVQPITTSFPQPDKRFFNKEAFDPTQPITIGQDNNPTPFNSQ